MPPPGLISDYSDVSAQFLRHDQQHGCHGARVVAPGKPLLNEPPQRGVKLIHRNPSMLPATASPASAGSPAAPADDQANMLPLSRLRDQFEHFATVKAEEIEEQREA